MERLRYRGVRETIKLNRTLQAGQLDAASLANQVAGLETAYDSLATEFATLYNTQGKALIELAERARAMQEDL